MRKFVFLPLVFAGLVLAAAGQTPSQTPAAKAVYKTYSAAMSAGKKLSEASKRADAVAAFEQAAALAKNDVQKADALIAAAKVQMDDSHTGMSGGKFKKSAHTVFHHPNAVRSLNTALDLPGIDDAKRAEIKIVRADVYFAANKHIDAHNQLVPDLEKQFGKEIRWIIRDEMTALAAAASTPPDRKAEALIMKARTYKNFLDKYANSADLKSAFDALNSATMVAGAGDTVKAEAFLQIAELARVGYNSSIFVAAYESVIKLPKATPTQKYKAATDLAYALIVNDRIEPARKLLTEALTVPGLTVAERGGIHRVLSVSFVREIHSKKPAKAAEDALMASARNELELAAKQTKLKGDDLSEAYRKNGEFIRTFNDAICFRLAREQLKAALAVPGITEREKARVQYELGETYRLENKLPEAQAAYKLVTNANPQYYGYAQRQIKDISSAKPGN
ncbi:MAG: hypothetical protein AB7F88_04630 [Pyrinomonadaceae bacterium]